MGRLDPRRPGQIGDGARQLQDAMIGPWAEVELGHGRLQQPPMSQIDLARLGVASAADQAGVADGVWCGVEARNDCWRTSSKLKL